MRTFRIEAKWASVLWVMTLMWFGFEHVMGWHDERILDHALYTNIYDLIFIGAFALAIKAKKSRSQQHRFTWKQGFNVGLTMTVIMVLLSPLTQFLVHTYISPDFFTNMIDVAMEHRLLNKFEAYQQFNLKNYIIQNAIGTTLLGLITSAVLAYLFKTSSK